MADLTEISGFLRVFSFTLVVIFDAFSRLPLSAKLFISQPDAASIKRLFQQTASRYGPPRHFVSDQGCQFTAAAFRKTLSRLGVLHRFGAIGKTGSIALIERLWRTIKALLRLPLAKSLVPADLQRRTELALTYYAWHRPHQSLAGATPAEVHFRLPQAHLDAVHPPRGRPGEGPPDRPLLIRYLDLDLRLPILVKRAA